MSGILELFIHPLCPFAQRILYVSAFKGVPCKLTEIDLSQKPEWLNQLIPQGNFPALKISSSTSTQIIHDSLIISQYLDSYPGPSLYPKSQPDSNLVKALIDLTIISTIEPLRKQIALLYFNTAPSIKDLTGFKKSIDKVNKLLENSEFLGDSAFGYNQVSFIDVMALPLIERIIAFKDIGFGYYDGVDLHKLHSWFERMSEFPWVSQHKMPLVRYINLRKWMQSGKYDGLKLPASIYDAPPLT